MPLDRRAGRLLAMLAASQTKTDTSQTPAARRAALRVLAEMADDASTPAEVSDLRCPGPDGGQLHLRKFSPTDALDAAAPGLVFIHGGGWVAGDLDTHDGFCRRLALAAGGRVIAVDYRRAPEHPFPAALDDCLAAVRWVAAHADALGVDPDRLAVGGDSVGGGLAAAVALATRGDTGPRLNAQALICPILDAGCATGSRAELADGYFISKAAFAGDLAAYLPPEIDADDPRLSPLHAASLAGLPPTILHTAQFDPFRDEGEAYAERLRAAGVPIQVTRHPGQIHYFYAMARAIPAAHDAATLIGAQLRAVFAAAGAGTTHAVGRRSG